MTADWDDYKTRTKDALDRAERSARQAEEAVVRAKLAAKRAKAAVDAVYRARADRLLDRMVAEGEANHAWISTYPADLKAVEPDPEFVEALHRTLEEYRNRSKDAPK